MTSDDVPDIYSAPWPTVPLPSYPFTDDVSTDFASHFAGEMALAHNVLIRGLNALWHHAPLLDSTAAPGDVVSYANYGLAAVEAIHLHHSGEEAVIFPALARAGMGEAMERNVGEHEVFCGPLDQLEGYLKGLVGGTEGWSAERMTEVLKEFADPLVKHLHDEISTIQPEALQKIDKSVFDQLNKDFDAHVKPQASLFITIPYILTAHKSEEAPAWPPFPGPVKWIAQNVLYHVHSEYWKFAPYDKSGKPQALPQAT